MNATDTRLKRLQALAGRPAPVPPAAAPPWFARRVVRVWLAQGTDASAAASWGQVSRRGLAWAAAVMGVSLALNFHLWPHVESPEDLASQSVVRLLLPR